MWVRKPVRIDFMNNNSVLEAKIDGLAGAVSKVFEDVHEKFKEM